MEFVKYFWGHHIFIVSKLKNGAAENVITYYIS